MPRNRAHHQGSQEYHYWQADTCHMSTTLAVHRLLHWRRELLAVVLSALLLLLESAEDRASSRPCFLLKRSRTTHGPTFRAGISPIRRNQCGDPLACPREHRWQHSSKVACPARHVARVRPLTGRMLTTLTLPDSWHAGGVTMWRGFVRSATGTGSATVTNTASASAGASLPLTRSRSCTFKFRLECGPAGTPSVDWHMPAMTLAVRHCQPEWHYYYV
jgi:hypothetical protein